MFLKDLLTNNEFWLLHVWYCFSITATIASDFKQMSAFCIKIRFQPNDHKTIKETADELKIFEGIKHPNLVRYFGVELHRVRRFWLLNRFSIFQSLHLAVVFPHSFLQSCSTMVFLLFPLSLRKRCISLWNIVMKGPWRRSPDWDSRSTLSDCTASRSLLLSMCYMNMALCIVTLKVCCPWCLHHVTDRNLLQKLLHTNALSNHCHSRSQHFPHIFWPDKAGRLWLLGQAKK